MSLSPRDATRGLGSIYHLQNEILSPSIKSLGICAISLDFRARVANTNNRQANGASYWKKRHETFHCCRNAGDCTARSIWNSQGGRARQTQRHQILHPRLHAVPGRSLPESGRLFTLLPGIRALLAIGSGVSVWISDVFISIRALSAANLLSGESMLRTAGRARH